MTDQEYVLRQIKIAGREFSACVADQARLNIEFVLDGLPRVPAMSDTSINIIVAALKAYAASVKA